MKKKCYISIDCDSLGLYEKIYGITPDLKTSNVVYEKGLLRFLNILQGYNAKATVFAVAGDLDNKINQGMIREFSNQGHEIGSHSLTHPYQFIKLKKNELEQEIVKSKEIIEQITQVKVKGFRAPGYNISKQAIGLLKDNGFAYDSSILPSVEYFLLRAFMIMKLRMTGKKTGSVFGKFSNFASHNYPFQLNGIQELPISIAKGSRFPMVGTFMMKLRKRRLPFLFPFMLKHDYLHIEFHGIDMVDAWKDGLDSQHKIIPEVLIPLDEKIQILDTLFGFLKKHYSFQTLKQCNFE